MARTQVFPVPAGPVMISTVRAEVRTCQMAAAWSSRSPRGAARLARVARAAAQLRLEHCRVGAQAPRRQLARQVRRALRLRVRDQLLFHGQLRGGGVPRDAGRSRRCARRAGGAATSGSGGHCGCLQAHHLAGPAGQRLLGQAEQQLLRRLRAHLPGLRRHDQCELLDQVMPGPGRVLGRD